MRKTSLMFVIIVLLVSVSAQAQKPGRQPAPIGPPVKSLLSVQDQEGGGFLVFDVTSGTFKGNMCEHKIAIEGTGQVKVDGFNVYLSAVSDSYQIFVSLNVWDRQGKAVIEMFQSPDGKTDLAPIREFWTDLNIDDNRQDCVSFQPAR
jgi:hypothetical protein